MRKLATIIGALACLSAMKEPPTRKSPNVVNNYFIKSSGGCGGSCGGNCHCKH